MALEPRAVAALPLGVWARVTGAWTTADARVLDAVAPLVVTGPGFFDVRLKWRSREPLTLLELRAAVLAPTLQLPAREEYFGCFSWLQLAPDELAAAGDEWRLTPALSDGAFADRQRQLRDALAGLDVAPLALPSSSSSGGSGAGLSSRPAGVCGRPAGTARRRAVAVAAADDRAPPGGSKAGGLAAPKLNPVYLAIIGAYAALLAFRNPYIYAVLTVLTILPQNSNVTSLNNLVLLFYESGLFMNFAEAVTCVRLVTWLSMAFMVGSFAVFK
ncbi:hypothetical protein HT031_002553 [Scenedesmus sp. PABB004]|nr:hypothetical protein HT031_002553 [Scenedesmus sp. PABB004]